jgi:hypothetical protein
MCRFSFARIVPEMQDKERCNCAQLSPGIDRNHKEAIPLGIAFLGLDSGYAAAQQVDNQGHDLEQSNI